MRISSYDALNPFPGGRAAFSLLVLPKLAPETAKERPGAPLFFRSPNHPRPRISGEHEGSMADNLMKKTAKTAGAVGALPNVVRWLGAVIDLSSLTSRLPRSPGTPVERPSGGPRNDTAI
jgi:hypothetical protein